MLRHKQYQTLQFDKLYIEALLKNVQWFALPGQLVFDGPIELDLVDKFIKDLNIDKNLVISSGFVKVSQEYNLPPHEDNFLEDEADNYKNIDSNYINWLILTGRRKSALMFPIYGDFTNVKTSLFWKHNKEFFESFTLNHGPVLFQTGGDTLHSVNNISSIERITFQLSFGDNYEYIKNKIHAT